MKKVLILSIVLMVSAASAHAQWGIAVGFGGFPGPRGLPGAGFHNAMVVRHLQQMQMQRFAQAQAVAAHYEQQQYNQTQQQYQEEAAIRQRQFAEQELRTEERIRELKDQQLKMEAQFHDLLMVLLARQSPDPGLSPSRGNVEALRSELQGLKDSLQSLKQELSHLSTQ